MPIQILDKPIPLRQVHEIAKEWYGTMIKGTVDIIDNKVAIGGDYHMESLEVLVKNGSNHSDVWGFNIHFDENEGGVLEFDSLVNIKPALENKSRSVESKEIIDKASKIIHSWIQF